MWCPICMKSYAATDTSYTECPDCLKDFQEKRWRFKLPNGLKQEPTCFYEYRRMGEVIERLYRGYLTPEEYEKKMAEVVAEINLQVELAKTTKTEEQQRSKMYAEGLRLR